MKPLRTISVPVLLLAVTVTSAGASFLASPMEHHLSTAAGRSEMVNITLYNTGTRPLTLKLYLADSRFDARGLEEDVAAGVVARSCAPWIDAGTQVIELGPAETEVASLHLNVPESAEGGYWTKLFIEEISTPEPRPQQLQGRSYQIFIRQRMGVRIFQAVPGTLRPDAAVSLMTVHETSGGREVMTRVVNLGNTILDCRATVELRNSRGETAQTLEPAPDGVFRIFPPGHRDITVASTIELPPDTYTAVAIVDFGGDHLVAGEEVFRVEGEQELTRLQQGTDR